MITAPMFLDAGYTARRVTCGGPASGSDTSRTGSGLRPTTCGRRAATSSWMASGTGRSNSAACSLPQSAWHPPYWERHGPTSPNTSCSRTSSWGPCSSGHRTVTTILAITLTPVTGGAVSSPGSITASGRGVTIRISPTTDTATAASDWERNLRSYYAGRSSGEIARPPHTLVQQNTAIHNLVTNKTEHANVNESLKIPHIQNVGALVPITKIHNTTATSLGSLNPKMAGGKIVPGHVLKVETMPREQRAEARKAITQSREAGLHRHQAEAKILASRAAPVKATDPPKVVRIEMPRRSTLPPNGPKPPRPPKPPPAPKLPAHVEKPIPHHEPPKPARPPKK